MNNLSSELELSKDDEFFNNLERGHTTLDQLFGNEGNYEHDNYRLKYQPPKQVTSNDSSSSWNIRLVKVANAFKAEDSLGKVAVALLENRQGGCKLITYKSKTHILGCLTLSFGEQIVQLHKQSRYLQFYDDDGIYWSLYFPDESDEKAFIGKLEEFGTKIHQEQKSRESLKEINNFERVTTTIDSFESTKEYNGEESGSEVNLKEENADSKTMIISRMAKMGQQLPKFAVIAEQGSNTTEYSDSSDTEPFASSSGVCSKPTILTRASRPHTKSHQNQIITASNLSVYKPSSGAIDPMESQLLQMLVSENRTQNTEIRLNMSKLESKIEKVLDRVDLLSCGTQKMDNKEDEVLDLEEKILQLKKENRKLKHALVSKEDNAETLMAKHDELNERLTMCQSNLFNIEAALARNTKLLHENERKLREGDERCAKALDRVHELETIVHNLETALGVKEDNNAELQCKLLEQRRLNCQQIEQQTGKFITTLKSTMNTLYEELITSIQDIENLSKEKVISIIARTIRDGALGAIEELKD